MCKQYGIDGITLERFFYLIAIRVCFQADDDWLSFVDLGDARRGRDF